MKKTDLRIEKTYSALKDAFTELLSKKKFEDITVNELCDKAIIRRATFYKHFADKLEFFSFYCNEFHRDYIQNLSFDKSNNKACLNSLLDFLEEHKPLLQSMQNSKMASSLIETLSSSMILTTKEMFHNMYKTSFPKEVNYELLTQILTGASIYAVKWWLENDTQLDKETFIAQIEQIFALTISLTEECP